VSKILLIEDDPRAREMLRFRFEKPGITSSKRSMAMKGL